MTRHEHTTQELRDEIDATRRELGATVEQLAAKTALKALLRGRVEDVRDDMTSTREEITDRGQQIASNLYHGIYDTAKHGVHQAGARVERRPVRAAAIAGAAVVLIIGLSLSRRTA